MKVMTHEMSGFPITKPQAWIAFVITIMLLTVWGAHSAGLLIGNPTPSVPRGLYYAVSPERAEYVTFCLAKQHNKTAWYAQFCSPDKPNGIKILKRITKRRENGSLIVSGDTSLALDSRHLGAIERDQIQGWWRPMVQIDAR